MPLLDPRHPTFSWSADEADVKQKFQDLDAELQYLSAQWQGPDARHVAFSNAHIWVAVAGELYNAFTARANEATFRTLFGAVGGSRDDHRRPMDAYLRLSLLTFVQFQLENLLANLLRAFGVVPPLGHAQVVTEALGVFGYPSIDRGRQILRVPAAIRNSLHMRPRG